MEHGNDEYTPERASAILARSDPETTGAYSLSATPSRTREVVESPSAAKAFCRICSYQSTARKQGLHALEALQEFFQNSLRPQFLPQYS